jgi:hypothetical protein
MVIGSVVYLWFQKGYALLRVLPQSVRESESRLAIAPLRTTPSKLCNASSSVDLTFSFPGSLWFSLLK